MRQNLVKVCTKDSPYLISNLIPPTSVQYTFQLKKIFYILSCSTRACTFDIIFFSNLNIHISKQPPPHQVAERQRIVIIDENVKVKHATKKNLCHITSEQFQISNLSIFFQTNPDGNENNTFTAIPIYLYSVISWMYMLQTSKIKLVLIIVNSFLQRTQENFPKKNQPCFFISQTEILVKELEFDDGNSFPDSTMLPLTKVQRCWFFFLLLHLIESPFIWQWRAQMGTRLYNTSLFRQHNSPILSCWLGQMDF